MRSPSKMAVPAAASVVFKRAPADCRTKPAGAVCPGKAAPKSRHDKAAARRRQLIIVQDLIGKRILSLGQRNDGRTGTLRNPLLPGSAQSDTQPARKDGCPLVQVR